MAPAIKTRILILSDTHGQLFPSGRHPQNRADVVIHCGDLTMGSKIGEFRTALALLKSLSAPLKLVIAGNHDFTLDLPMFRKKVADAGLDADADAELITREYGRYGEARQLFDDARHAHGIHLLDEGTHRFVLGNGAALTVYASPFTASETACWGYQYTRTDSHDFAVEEGTDVVVTHSPPEGILDRTESLQRAGAPDLFRSVARARPRLHCFGHIHEGWGAKLVAWRDPSSMIDPPSHFTAIDNGRSAVVDTLQSFRRGEFDNDETAAAKTRRLEAFQLEGCRPTSHGSGDSQVLEPGKHTLFVNASITGDEAMQFHLPWLVDLELPQSPVDNTEASPP